MLDVRKFAFEPFVDLLRAAAEPTRLRLLVLLAAADLTVSELTTILGQSQPRISRHLKLLAEAGLISRYQEGSWAFFRASDDPVALPVMRALVGWIDGEDPVLARDAERLAEVRVRIARVAERAGRNADGSPIEAQLGQHQIKGRSLVGLQRKVRTNADANTAIDITIQTA